MVQKLESQHKNVAKLYLHKTWTSGLPGHIASEHFWQVCPHKEFQKMIVITFEHL